MKSVAFVSQESLENHVKPEHDVAVISITDPEKPEANIRDGFHSVLRVKFHDVYEEKIAEFVGNVPDMDCDGHLIKYQKFTLPDISHARLISEFIKGLSTNSSCQHLFVHCHAGVSRSAAVAQFVADRYAVPIEQANDDTSALNKRLLRLLNKVFFGHEVVYGKFIPKGNAPRSESLYSNDKFLVF